MADYIAKWWKDVTKSVAYKDYGAKGITVCNEWHDRDNFRKWAIDNGYVKGLRLERIDTKKGYSPGNCRFGTTMKKNKYSGSQHVKKIRKHRDFRKSLSN